MSGRTSGSGETSRCVFAVSVGLKRDVLGPVARRIAAALSVTVDVGNSASRG